MAARAWRAPSCSTHGLGEHTYEIWVYACADTVSGVDDLTMNSSTRDHVL
jgi:hypothetical protein